MNARLGIMLAALAAFASLLLVFAIRIVGGDDRGSFHTLDLAGGERLRGLVIRLQEQTYIVHTDTASVIVPGSEIRRVDGREPRTDALGATATVPFTQATYEDIREDDVVVVRSTMSFRNGSEIRKEAEWGLGAHELGFLANYHVFDEFGNDVPYRLEDAPAIRGKRIVLTLPRPILPGEVGRLTTVFEDRERLFRSGEDRVYRTIGDYPDNRLVTRTVVLPAGARVVSVSPEPLRRITVEGRTVLVWRRYFHRAEQVPWEVRYRL